MGVIQKKVVGENGKKKNKLKANIKQKLETNTKFPKVKNSQKPAGPNKNGEKILEPKKKFEKNIQKGNPPSGSPKPKQNGNKSPKQKKNKKNKTLKQKPDKSIKTDGDIELTAEEIVSAIKTAKAVKNDNDGINDLLTKILTKNVKKEENEPSVVGTSTGLQLEELISKDTLKKQVKSFMKIIKHAKSQPEYKTKLINDKSLITLSVLAMKIPDCPNKNIRIKLPVPLFTTDSEICLFVADLERGRKRDDEPFVRHYEEILDKNGVTCVNKIITVSHLIKEYSTYELKYRLANTYDVFLVEGKVSNRVGAFLGSIFANIKRNPIPVKDFTKESIESALNIVTYRQSGLGPVNVINFAHDAMSESDITENLYSLVQQFKKIYPGGWTNVKSLTLTALKELAYPIMFNFASPNDIPVPKLRNIQDVKIQKAKQLLDGALQKVEITSDGLLVKKKSKRKFDDNELLSNSENEEDETPIVQSTIVGSSLSKPKKKKKKNDVKEPESVIKTEPELKEIPTSKKKKKNDVKEPEPVIKTEPELEEIPTSKKKKKNDVKEPEFVIKTKQELNKFQTSNKDKKKKKNKELVLEEQKTIVEMPEQVIKKQKNHKKNIMTNFTETNSLVNNIKPAQKAKFEKPTTTGVKPKKKKFSKAN